MLRLPDHWVWDSWMADDGERYHLFFLQAPRSLGDLGRRHLHAGIGHASSTDLVDWTVHEPALAVSADGWDDLSLWTGSVARGDDGRWRLFYTALNSHRGHGERDQRIGLAVSDNLLTWQRVGTEPLLPAAGGGYRTLDEDHTASETWRDPFVFRDEGGDGWHMLVTARLRDAPRLDDGTLAHARSRDLAHWEVGAPVTTRAAGFGQLEVAQVHRVDDRPVLLFTGHPEEQTEARRREHGVHCTWSVVGPPGGSLLGPWDLADAVPFRAEPWLFAAPLVRRRDGLWVLLGFLHRDAEGVDSLAVVDPIPVQIDGDGLQATAGARRG